MTITFTTTPTSRVAVKDGVTIGAWLFPGGTPYGWHIEDGEDGTPATGRAVTFTEYMPWLLSVSGTPKVWIVSEASASAYFLTWDDRLGYAMLDRNGAVDWTLAGMVEDTEGEYADEHDAAEAALHAFVAAAPGFIAALHHSKGPTA